MRPFALLLLLLLPAGSLSGQEAIHRCMGADGIPVFTDRPCAALHATPVTAAPSPSPPDAVAPAPPATLCAATPQALKQAVVDAFAAHDPNRLAGLMLWRGYGSHAVVADIRALARLMSQPLLGIHLAGTGDADGDDAPATSATAPDAAPVPIELVLSTAADDGSGTPRQSRFEVRPRAGCLWLEPSG